MRWVVGRVALAAAMALAATGCGRLGLGPPKAASAPPIQEATPAAPDLRPYRGSAYSDFVVQPGLERYAVAALGLTDVEQARFARAMAAASPGRIVAGGGAEALVFSGCAEGGCAEGAAVVAIDLATGAAFVGVRDAQGADDLAPNDRLEALLRLRSPTRRWDDLEPPDAVDL